MGKISTEFLSEADEIDVSDSEDLNDSGYSSGRKHREASGEFNIEYNGVNNISDLYDAYDDGTLLPFIYGGIDSGDLIFTGNLFIRDIDGNDPDNDRSNLSIAMRISGNVAKTVVDGGFPYVFPYILS